MPPAKSSYLKIYSENYDDMIKLPIDNEHLKGLHSVWYKSLYTLDWEYNLNDLNNITFQSPNIINLTITNYTVKIIFLDDYTYFKVRSILLTYAKSKNFQKIKIHN